MPRPLLPLGFGPTCGLWHKEGVQQEGKKGGRIKLQVYRKRLGRKVGGGGGGRGGIIG